jgi:type IV pilus assembly protein PilE
MHKYELQGFKKRMRGFTLIELMIVMVVIAILASIAYPAYTSHLKKGRRAQAQAFLMNIAQRQQQYFTDRRSYALDSGSTKAYDTLSAPISTDISPYYTVTTAARATTPSFIVTATPIGKQASDGTLTIDDTGAKTGSW